MRSTAYSLRLAGAAVLLFASAAPVLAADTTERSPSDAAATADSGAAKPAAKPAKGDRKICRAEGNTGSNLPSKKICLTAREWKERADVEF